MATTKEETNKTKVLVNVYEPLITIMKHKMDAACLKRDAYLDKALQHELTFLLEEVPTSNSDKAKSYIADNLKQLRLKPLNLLLSSETVELMNEMCKVKNIPRDAFINRVFLLLIATDTVIDKLFFGLFKKTRPNSDIESWRDDWAEWANGNLNHYSKMDRCFNRPNILDSIEEFVKINPFWRLRDYFSCYDELWKMYSYPFEKTALNNLPQEYFYKTDNALGFNTFMTDEDVSKQELLDRPISEKVTEIHELIAYIEKEKQARAAKNKPAGEAQ